MSASNDPESPAISESLFKKILFLSVNAASPLSKEEIIELANAANFDPDSTVKTHNKDRDNLQEPMPIIIARRPS